MISSFICRLSVPSAERLKKIGRIRKIENRSKITANYELHKSFLHFCFEMRKQMLSTRLDGWFHHFDVLQPAASVFPVVHCHQIPISSSPSSPHVCSFHGYVVVFLLHLQNNLEPSSSGSSFGVDVTGSGGNKSIRRHVLIGDWAPLRLLFHGSIQIALCVIGINFEIILCVGSTFDFCFFRFSFKQVGTGEWWAGKIKSDIIVSWNSRLRSYSIFFKKK